MKTLITALTLAAGLFTSAASAQQTQPAPVPATPEQRAERQTLMMTKRLHLTPEQVEKVKAINLKYVNDAKAMHEERKDDKNAKPGAFHDMKQQKDAELKEVLTAGQYTDYLAMEQKVIDRHKEAHEKRKAEQAAPAETK